MFMFCRWNFITIFSIVTVYPLKPCDPFLFSTPWNVFAIYLKYPLQGIICIWDTPFRVSYVFVLLVVHMYLFCWWFIVQCICQCFNQYQTMRPLFTFTRRFRPSKLWVIWSQNIFHPFLFSTPWNVFAICICFDILSSYMYHVHRCPLLLFVPSYPLKKNKKYQSIDNGLSVRLNLQPQCLSALTIVIMIAVIVIIVILVINSMIIRYRRPLWDLPAVSFGGSLLLRCFLVYNYIYCIIIYIIVIVLVINLSTIILITSLFPIPNSAGESLLLLCFLVANLSKSSSSSPSSIPPK